MAEPYTELPFGLRSPCPDSSCQPTHLVLPLSLLPRPDSGGPRHCLTCCLWDNIGLQLWGEKRDEKMVSPEAGEGNFSPLNLHSGQGDLEKTPGAIPFLLLPALRRRQPKQLSFLELLPNEPKTRRRQPWFPNLSEEFTMSSWPTSLGRIVKASTAGSKASDSGPGEGLGRSQSKLLNVQRN